MSAPRGRHFLASWFLVTICIVAGATFGYKWHGHLLEQLAVVWTVSDPISKSDAAVVLGGGISRRTEIAADLYDRGFVEKILISDVTDSSHAFAPHFSDTEISRRILDHRAIPETAIYTFGAANKTTSEEAVALKIWSKRNHVTSFVIPTEFLFARRVRLIFDRQLSAEGSQVLVMPFQTPQLNQSNWWRTSEGRRAASVEFMKFIYYYAFNGVK